MHFFFVLFSLVTSQISGVFGILICENGLYCVSDEDCPIGNHCVDFVDGEANSTRCLPREDLDVAYHCSLSHKSCECGHKFYIIFLHHL